MIELGKKQSISWIAVRIRAKSSCDREYPSCYSALKQHYEFLLFPGFVVALGSINVFFVLLERVVLIVAEVVVKLVVLPYSFIRLIKDYYDIAFCLCSRCWGWMAL